MAELILALDLESAKEALGLVDGLPGLKWAKIGPVLFVKEGPAIVRELKGRGVRVFLDLKWHDIPSTVAGAAAAAEGIGVDLATVHALGGIEMLQAAVAAADHMKLVAVSILTSHSRETFWDTVGRCDGGQLGPEVGRLSRLAVGAGVAGIVTSPLEIADVRQAIGPDPWIVVPGIRLGGTEVGDQRRTAEPASAVAAGATHLVVGRPITRSDKPLEVYQSIRRKIE
jgi:orotidine-5'-phosphate decarboxylase